MLRRGTTIIAALIGLGVVCGAGLAGANDGSVPHRLTLPAWKAATLGLVEGITEYLPISSTGHLLVAERLLDVGTTEESRDAADTYAITIQAGAIASVLLLYRRRVADLVAGIAGRSDSGRRVLIGLAVAFVPAAATGVLFAEAIKNNLLEVGPVVAAWLAGALGIWILVPAVHRGGGQGLETITIRQASIIGLVQVLALWPGTSRSLVTIIAALAVGMSMSASVEFSFLLGLVTLGAATVYDGINNGAELVETFGIVTPVLGLLVAFVSATAAVKWMVSYLQNRDLRLFAVYRVAAAAAVAALLAVNAI